MFLMKVKEKRKGNWSVKKKKKVTEKVLKENVQVVFERLSGIRALRSRSSSRNKLEERDCFTC